MFRWHGNWNENISHFRQFSDKLRLLPGTDVPLQARELSIFQLCVWEVVVYACIKPSES